MITFDYPASANGEPARMNAIALAALARSFRNRIVGGPGRRPSIETIVKRTAALAVNGQRMRLAWDIEHDVIDDGGRAVLGECLHDPSEPETVMIYINGPQLADRPDVLLSTAAHELAHAVFDMPGALGGTVRRAFRTVADRTRTGPVDWVEWRADEFMGAFLVPPDMLARAVARHAGAMNLRLVWKTGRRGLPSPFFDDDPRSERAGWLLDALSETFGVSAAFMVARLRRCGFIGRPAETGRGQ